MSLHSFSDRGVGVSDAGDLRSSRLASAHEIRPNDDQILVLHGRVLELFLRDQPSAVGSNRWHVEHVAIEARERRGGGLKIGIGLRRGDAVRRHATVVVPAERVEVVRAFFDLVRREAAGVR